MESPPMSDILALHNNLHTRFRKYNIDLQAVTGVESVACVPGGSAEVIQYVRPSTAAQTVEAMMGRDVPNRRLEVRRHPVIEMRQTEKGLTIELIIAPHAW